MSNPIFIANLIFGIHSKKSLMLNITQLSVGVANHELIMIAGVRKKLGLKGNLYYNIGRPRICNLASTDVDLKGFVGGFTDGRYGYFVPQNNGAYFGKVARLYMNFGGNL